MSTSANWKATLQMPHTDFAMKANLNVKDPQFLARWAKAKIYHRALEQNKGNKKFVLHDGPPYANGDLHLGHALNKILKDFIVRRKTMEGFYAPFVLGWDTHGLPIENKMLELMHKTKDDFDPLALRQAARKYALEQVANQKTQFAQMALFTDWETTYVTTDQTYEARQLQLFKKLCLEKLVYKKRKPVYWSPSSQSALAEAEVEYQNHVSPQVIVALTVTTGNDVVVPGDHLLIMTTTPWTLVANAAIAFDKKLSYALVTHAGKRYVLGTDLVAEVAALAKWDDYQVVTKFSGQKLTKIMYQHPLDKTLTNPLVPGHHVSGSEGTGLVHIAPLFGEDDYVIGQKFDLKMVMHVDERGYFNKAAGDYQGQFYADANKAIGEQLAQAQALLSLRFIKHSYPHDWRTGKPIIFRGVPQWFVNIAALKPNIIAALSQSRSFPKWGVSQLQKMVVDRAEWTISRQRTWGVPIIIFYDQKKQPVFDAQIFDHVIALVQKHGTDIWWKWTADQLLPDQYRNQSWTKEMDIMDVWFDSGVSFMASNILDLTPPYDLYLEGNDQYRGWFNSSLINGVAWMDRAPFSQLISHGIILDKKHNKMSKSKGNVVSPLTIIKDYGIDILRLWVASSDYWSDITYSADIIKQVVETYRRIRNSCKFMLGNLADFDYQKDRVPLTHLHQYIAQKINHYQQAVQQRYDQYKFVDVIQLTNKLLIELSSWYFSQAKDTLYCDLPNDPERRAVQTNLYYALMATMQTLAPILPVTIEEVYDFFPHINKQDSIFLADLDRNNTLAASDQFATDFDQTYRKQANKSLETAIQNGHIKRTNEAILTVPFANQDSPFDDRRLARYFQVAQVVHGTKWKVERFDSEKCQRCWNHFVNTALNADHLCQRCEQVVAA